MNTHCHLDKWLFALFGLPLFSASVSTAATNIFAVLFVIVYLAGGYWRQWRTFLSRPWFRPLMALVAINFLGMLWTQDVAWGVGMLTKLKWCLFALAGATLPWNQARIVLIIRLYLGGLFLSAIIGGLQWLHLYPWLPMDPGNGPVGYTDRIFLSLALTSALIWLAYDLKKEAALPRYLSVILALIFFMQLTAIGGRAGLLAFALLFPLALWMLYPGRWRAWAMGVAVIGLAGLAYSPKVQERLHEVMSDIRQYQAGNTTTSVGLRLVFWEGALRMAAEHPLLGVGTGDYKMEMARLQQIHAIPETPGVTGIDHPHSSYLVYLANFGFPGLFILLWFLWAATAEAWRYRTQPIAWFKLSYMSIFILGSLTDTLIWGFHNALALGMIVAIPPLLKQKVIPSCSFL